MLFCQVFSVTTLFPSTFTASAKEFSHLHRTKRDLQHYFMGRPQCLGIAYYIIIRQKDIQASDLLDS